MARQANVKEEGGTGNATAHDNGTWDVNLNFLIQIEQSVAFGDSRHSSSRFNISVSRLPRIEKSKTLRLNLEFGIRSF